MAGNESPSVSMHVPTEVQNTTSQAMPLHEPPKPQQTFSLPAPEKAEKMGRGGLLSEPL